MSYGQTPSLPNTVVFNVACTLDSLARGVGTMSGEWGSGASEKYSLGLTLRASDFIGMGCSLGT